MKKKKETEKVENPVEEKVVKTIPKKTQVKLLPSEWARTFKKDEASYLYYDRQGTITESQFKEMKI